MEEIGKLLIGLGVIIIIVGGVLLLSGRLLWLGHLPGDISIQSENFSCLFPLATSILLSILLTIVLNILLRIMNK